MDEVQLLGISWRAAVQFTGGLERAYDGSEGSPCQVACPSEARDRLDVGQESATLPRARPGYTASPTVSCGKCGNDTGQCNCYLEDL